MVFRSMDIFRRTSDGLDCVGQSLLELFEAGIHLEVTNLVITGLNDSYEDINMLTDFIADISPDIPLHLSAYYPTYKMENPPTSPATLLEAYEIVSAKLKYVYLGNVNITGKSDTICPGCSATAVRRQGYRIDITGLDNGQCAKCGRELNIKIN